MRIKKGDMVIITAGRERGLTGRVRQVLPREDRVIIENRNIVKRHLKRGPQGQEGGILPKEAPVHRSNVMLFSETEKRGVRVSMRYVGADDALFESEQAARESYAGDAPQRIRKVRYAKKTGEIFD